MIGRRIFTAAFASVYPMYVQKAEREGRTKAEVDDVILDKRVDELAKGKAMEKILR